MAYCIFSSSDAGSQVAHIVILTLWAGIVKRVATDQMLSILTTDNSKRSRGLVACNQLVSFVALWGSVLSVFLQSAVLAKEGLAFIACEVLSVRI